MIRVDASTGLIPRPRSTLLRMAQAASTGDRRPPPCTVVIPTRQRPQQLRDCLRSIAELDYPKDRLELVVVDDGASSEATAEQAARELRGQLDIRVLETPHLGPAAARNAGARQAGGAILAFTDDDCRVERGWLATLAAAVGPAGANGAGGRTVNALLADRWARSSWRRTTSRLQPTPSARWVASTSVTGPPRTASSAVGGAGTGSSSSTSPTRSSTTGTT